MRASPFSSFAGNRSGAFQRLCRASPQTLTYAAALLTQAGSCGAWGLDWRDRVASLSPVAVQGQNSATVASEIGTLWQWLIRNN